MQQGSDESILALLATDLDRYYELLVSMYWHQLRVFVQRRTGSVQDAEDIVQEAFVRAYLALERYSVQQVRTLRLRSWLYKIAWNCYCNYITRAKKPTVSLDTSEESTLLEREDERDEQPEVAFELLERRQELEAILLTLPQHYRVVVSLYYFEDFTQQEIAEILNQPLGTVKVYVRRGIQLLRKKLPLQMNQVG